LEDRLIMGIKNGQSPARKRQSKSAPSSSKSKRSVAVPKNPVSRDNGKVANELDGNIVCDESRALQSEASAVVLEETGIIEGTGRTDLPDNPTELVAITLHQPWASLIAKGYKLYETRDWPTNHRGPIVIHAGRKPKSKQELREHEKVVESFKDLLNEDCPYSSVIAITQLTDVILMTDEFIEQQTETELRCGNWAVGRYALKLENVRAIEPIPAVGKQGLWKWNQEAAGFDSLHIYPLQPWNPADFGEVQHKAGADGQLNLSEWVDTEPPEPDDYEFKEEFQERYKKWAAAQPDKANDLQSKDWEKALAKQLKVGDRVKENLNNPEWGKTLDCLIKYGEVISDIYPGKYEPLTLVDIRWDDGKVGAAQVRFLEKVCNLLMDGSICAQESGSASPTLELNCGEEALTTSASGIAIADQSLSLDSPASTESTTSKNATLNSAAEYSSSQQALPALPSQLMETDSEPTTPETFSPTYSEQSENSSQTLQLSKTLEDCSVAPIPPAINQEPTSDLFSTPYPRAGTMRNGSVLPAPTLLPPGVESESLLLRSPGALSGSAGV
jgi:hypothetical protein